MSMINLGLAMAAAAACCCAYLAGLAMDRRAPWPTSYDRVRAIAIVGLMTVANVILVFLTSHAGMPISWGAIYVMLQVHVYVFFVMLHYTFSPLPRSLSVLFVGISIATLSVQLVGVRLTVISPKMLDDAGLLWSCFSFILISWSAIEGLRQGSLQRAVSGGGEIDHAR